MLPLGDNGDYATRARLVVLSLAAELGIRDWARIANVLNRSLLALSPGAREYTQGDCLCIYQEALKSIDASACNSGEDASVYRALCGIKGQRLNEIQARLQQIAREVDEMDRLRNKVGHVEQTKPGAQHVEPQLVGDIGRDKAGKAKSSAKESEPLSTAARESAALNNDTVASTLNDVGAPLVEECSTPREEPLVEPEHSLNLGFDRHSVITGGAPVVASASSPTLGQRDAPVASDSDVSGHDSNNSNVGKSNLEKPAPMPLDLMEPADKAMLEAGASKAEAGKAEPDIDYGAMEDGKDTARDSTPVLSASSTGRPASSTADEQQMRNWKKNINTVWRDISGHRLGSMFVSPIKAADAPSYYEVIRRPLDLKTIKNRIRDEEITTTVEFYRDIMHMLMNALMYNAEDTEVYQMTMQIIPDAQACIEQLLQTEAAVNQPRGAGSGDGTTVEYADDVTNSAADGGDAGANSRINEAEEAAKGGNDDGGSEMQADADDSDSSVPNKRRRRAASERASKHLRA